MESETDRRGGNEVFAWLPAEKADELSRRFHFYLWRDATRPGWTQVRWVTSWDTTESDVDELLGEL